MGTNFYFVEKFRKNQNVYDIEDKVHIGKRSAAGWYCWDCGVSLCKGRVHYTDKFYDACPKCGNKTQSEPLETSSAGRELGFNKSKPNRKTGVASCSSFTWAIRPGAINALKGKIVDEYGHKFTLKEFKQVLLECPIQSTDMVGHTFS